MDSTAKAHLFALTILAREIQTPTNPLSKMSAFSLYDTTIGAAIAALKTLDGLVTTAEKHPKADSLIKARLAPDMHPLSFQVDFAPYSGEALLGRLQGERLKFTPKEPGEELDTYEKMHQRINDVIKKLQAVDKDKVTEGGELPAPYTSEDGTKEVPAKVMVHAWNLPNIYFHVAMAYAILRKEGVPVGKEDWMNGFVADFE